MNKANKKQTNIRAKKTTRDALKDYRDQHDLHSLDVAIQILLHKAKVKEITELKGEIQDE